MFFDTPKYIYLGEHIYEEHPKLEGTVEPLKHKFEVYSFMNIDSIFINEYQQTNKNLKTR